ncbi:hypothetical protein GCM10020331_035640 [Ectobacillus funiculus]
MVSYENEEAIDRNGKTKQNCGFLFLIVLLIGGIIGATTKNITQGINLGLDLRGGFEVFI